MVVVSGPSFTWSFTRIFHLVAACIQDCREQFLLFCATYSSSSRIHLFPLRVAQSDMAAQRQPEEQDTNISINHNNISLSTQDHIFDSTPSEGAVDERYIKVAYGEPAVSSR